MWTITVLSYKYPCFIHFHNNLNNNILKKSHSNLNNNVEYVPVLKNDIYKKLLTQISLKEAFNSACLAYLVYQIIEIWSDHNMIKEIYYQRV